MWTTFVNNPLVQLAVRGVGLYVLALYLAMVFWTVRDAQQRTENPILPYLAGLLVVVLNILGLFLYLIVRPKETLGEAYERQLAEESLLAEADRPSRVPHRRWLWSPSWPCRSRAAAPSRARHPAAHRSSRWQRTTGLRHRLMSLRTSSIPTCRSRGCSPTTKRRCRSSRPPAGCAGPRAPSTRS